jgi:cell division septation protein DedD
MGRTQAQNLGVQKPNVTYERRPEHTPQVDTAPAVSTRPVPQQELEPLRDQSSANSVIVPPEYVPVVAATPPPVAVQPTKASRKMALPRPPAVKANPSSAIPSTHWVVQLAAHESSNAARAHWGKMQKSVYRVAPGASSMVALFSNSEKPVYRLAIGAFAEFTAAETVCQDLRAQDQNCMVRRFGSLGTVQWTDKTTSSYAGSK